MSLKRTESEGRKQRDPSSDSRSRRRRRWSSDSRSSDSHGDVSDSVGDNETTDLHKLLSSTTHLLSSTTTYLINHANPGDSAQDQFNNMFELLQEMSRLQNTPTTEKSSVVRLSQNAVYQSKDDVQLEIAYSVLGYGQEDVTVEANNNILKVKAKKEDVESIQSKLIKEIDDTITINKDYDLEKAECSIKNGVLLIVIPKKEDTLAKKLQIKLLK